MDGDIFVLCDTRLGLADEAPLKKIWGETVTEGGWQSL